MNGTTIHDKSPEGSPKQDGRDNPLSLILAADDCLPGATGTAQETVLIGGKAAPVLVMEFGEGLRVRSALQGGGITDQDVCDLAMYALREASGFGFRHADQVDRLDGALALGRFPPLSGRDMREMLANILALSPVEPLQVGTYAGVPVIVADEYLERGDAPKVPHGFALVGWDEPVPPADPEEEERMMLVYGGRDLMRLIRYISKFDTTLTGPKVLANRTEIKDPFDRLLRSALASD